jgi:hypothetical protein
MNNVSFWLKKKILSGLRSRVYDDFQPTPLLQTTGNLSTAPTIQVDTTNPHQPVFTFS